MATTTPTITLPGYDPVTIQPWLCRVIIAMTLLALFATGLRILSRHIKKQGLWWDDWMIIFSQIWMLVTIGTLFGLYSLGVGLHISDVPNISTAKLETMTKLLLAGNFFYFWNLVWTKLSVLLMYYRIFKFGYFKNATWIIGGLVVAWGVAITFLTFFICYPVEKLWDASVPGRCMDKALVRLLNAISTILSDLVILVLPIPQVWKLQLRRSQKIALTIVFSLGSFVIFTSIYRVTVVLLQNAADPTYTLAPTLGWTTIEISAGIVSSSLPTIGPAVAGFFTFVGLRAKIGLSGIKGSRAAGSGNPGSRLDSKATTAREQGLDPAITNTGNQLSTTPSNPFYRLSDSDDSADSVNEVPTKVVGDAFKLRPSHGYSRSVTGGRSHGGDGVSDEIPLNAILVETSFVQSTNKSPA